MIRKYICMALSISVLLGMCGCERITTGRISDEKTGPETVVETSREPDEPGEELKEPEGSSVLQESAEMKEPERSQGVWMAREKSSEEKQQETEEKNDGWKEQYKNILKKYQEQPEQDCWYYYYIYDIEENGVPELLIYVSRITPVSSLYFYSYEPETDKEVDLGEIEVSGLNLCGLYGENGIINQVGKMEYETDYILKLSDGQMEKDLVFDGHTGDFHHFDELNRFELSDISGIESWAGNPEDNNRKVIDAFTAEYVISDSSSRELTDADIKGMDQDTLWLAIDEIAARHGMKFENEGRKSYFTEKSWYAPFRSVTDMNPEEEFSELEWNNIGLMTGTIMKQCDLSAIPPSREFTAGLPEDNCFLYSQDTPIEHDGYYELPHVTIYQWFPDEWGMGMDTEYVTRDTTLFIRKDARFHGVLAKQYFDNLGCFYQRTGDYNASTVLNTCRSVFDENGYLIEGTAHPFG